MPPIDPNTVGPTLEALGYRYVSGWGPTAIWEAPGGVNANGSKYEPYKITEQQAAKTAYGTSSPYETPPASATDRSGQVGLNPTSGKYEYFTYGSDGKPAFNGVQAPPMNPNPGHSSSTSTNTSTNYSISDPAQLANARDIANIQETGANARNLATIGQQQAQLQAQIQQWQRDYGMQTLTLQFNKDKAAFEQSIGKAADARATQQQVFTQQQGIASLQFQIATATAQHQQLQAQMDQQVSLANASEENSTARFNSQQEFNVEQANQQASDARASRLQGLAKDISTAAADPGDRGRYAALVLANSAYGHDIGNADTRTTDSLLPLQSLLTNRKDVLGQPERPYNFTPIQPNLATPGNAGPLDLSKVVMPTAVTPASVGGATNAPAAASTAVPVTQGNSPGSPGWIAALLGAGYHADTSGVGQITPEQLAQTNAAVPALKDGGEVNGPLDLKSITSGSGAYISGEAGPELNIPLAAGKALVLNKAQLDKLDPKHVKTLLKMADGGIFAGGTVFDNTTGGDTSDASNFLQEAVKRARAGTPFETGELPGSTFASTPGFDPLVSQLLASIRAQATGQPASSFLRNAALFTPAGMNEAPIRRTA